MARSLIAAALLGGALALSGCEAGAAGGSEQAAAAPARKLETIDAAGLSARLAKGDVLLIDVRTAKEFAEGHLAGAINLPVESFDPKALPKTDGKELILYCRSGRRSALAGEKLLEAGSAKALHLDGGILAWREAGLPTVQ